MSPAMKSRMGSTVGCSAGTAHPRASAQGGARGVRRERIIDTLITIACKPADDRRIVGPAIVQKRKDVRGRVNNRMAETLCDLLDANDGWDEMGALCRDVARGPALAMDRNYKPTLVRGLDATCDEMKEVARALSGDESTAELLRLEDRLSATLAALVLAKESVQAEIDARRLSVAA